jgi:nicotinamide riboside transporter PnuC
MLLNMGVKAVLYFCVSVKGFGWLFWVQRGQRCDKHCNGLLTYIDKRWADELHLED